MIGPRVHQVNVVVPAVEAAADFLAALGVDLAAPPPGWARHHRKVPTVASTADNQRTVSIELDSSRFAHWWGSLPRDFTGVVVNLLVASRIDVDRLHDDAVASDGRSLTAPHDAFWGARYALVEGPGPLIVGIMSEIDDDRRSAPPDPTTFD